MTKLICSTAFVLTLFTGFIAKAQSGSSFNDPFIVGNMNYYGYYYDTQYNEYPNYYLGSNWIPGDNIYYSFTLDSYSEVGISNCGSNLDTYLTLMDEWGNYVYSNDDNGPQCGGGQASIQLYLSPGTYVFSTRAVDHNNWGGYINTSISVQAATCTSYDGATQSNAIQAGNFSASGSFTDTRLNDHCMGNDIGTPSDDIYYQFSLSSKANVTMSHCGSGFDTYMWLLDGNGTPIVSNDDSWSQGPCPGLEAYIYRELDPGTYYLVSEGYSTNSGSIVTSIQVSITGGGTLPPGTFQPLCSTLAASPSYNQNYILTYVPRIATTDGNNLNNLGVCQANQTIQYFDGLGRPSQTVQTKASPAGNDIILPITYDEFGRETTKYLPYVSPGNDGRYKSTALNDVISYYYNNGTPLPGQSQSFDSPFSKTVFEPSPLNRVTEQGAPGAAWQPANGHTLKTEYHANTGSEVLLWQVTSNGASAGGNYAAHELYKTIIKDENWTSGQAYLQAGTTEEFKDKEGKVILKRTFNHNTSNNTLETLSTYYVYDEYGNLRYVIPPGVTSVSFTEAAADADFHHYIYAYHYDHRNRVIEKKIPEKGWEELMYNTLDQVVLTRDALQASQNNWLFTKYDGLGRVISTGVFNSADSRVTLQGQIDAAPLWENRNPGSDYPGTAFPSSGADYLTVNYYDDYSFGNDYPFAAHTYSLQKTERAKGLLTISKVKVLNTGQYLKTVNYYDEDARLIQSHVQNNIGGVDRTDNQYSFTGELIASTRIHSSSTASVTIANRYVYDHVGRKKQTFQKTGDVSSPEVLLSELEYTETGQLLEKKLADNLQSTSYTYNPRGWLKSSTSPEFAMTLNYEDASGTDPQYNGNISNQSYTNGAGNTFTYSYDKLNRLTAASAPGLTEHIGYDNMGNIQSLYREGYGTNAYNSYAGNRLMSITGFLNGTYDYDANGNMKIDGPKGINIDYNQLNLPQAISGAQNITYTYDATGTKLRKQAAATTDYIKGIHYTNGSIEFIQTEAGLARNNGGTYSYEYNLTDHLGNTRATFHKDPNTHSITVLQRDDYYAFGLRKNPPSQTSSNETKYLYNGKELQEELGQYDYGARFYDPMVARWTSIDPHSEKYASLSPYNYVYNNPLKHIDPDGKDGIVSIKGNTITVSSNIYIYGSGATAANARQMQNDIMKAWGSDNGKPWSYTDGAGNAYNVKFDVSVSLYDGKAQSDPFIIPESWDPTNRDNFIEVGASLKEVGRSFVQGGDEGEWRGTGRNGMSLSQDNPAPHEFGHLMGLGDRYTDAKGVNPGWKGNIMGESGTGKVEKRNINGIIGDAMKAYEAFQADKNNANKPFKYEIDTNNPDKERR